MTGKAVELGEDRVVHAVCGVAQAAVDRVRQGEVTRRVLADVLDDGAERGSVHHSVESQLCGLVTVEAGLGDRAGTPAGRHWRPACRAGSRVSGRARPGATAGRSRLLAVRVGRRTWPRTRSDRGGTTWRSRPSAPCRSATQQPAGSVARKCLLRVPPAGARRSAPRRGRDQARRPEVRASLNAASEPLFGDLQVLGPHRPDNDIDDGPRSLATHLESAGSPGMRVVFAPDKFAGTLTAVEAAAAIGFGVGPTSTR